MTAPTTQPTPDKITAAELRATLAELREEIETMREEVRAAMIHLQRAATATPPAATAGQFAEMQINAIIMTYDDKGKPSYKATGTPYNKFGVRVWDEVLPSLGIDPASLKPGPNIQPAPIFARVQLKTGEDGKQTPQKVTGKA